MTPTSPQITGIEHVAPKTNRFKMKDVNVFYVLGQNLSGLAVTALAGKTNHGNKPVAWTDVETLSNTNPRKLLVKGIPDKGSKLTEGEGLGEADEPPQAPAPAPAPAPDPGSISVTVTGGVTQQLPVDYEP